MTIFKLINVFSWKIGGWPSHCLIYVDAACFTDIGFCVVFQSFMPIIFQFLWGRYKKTAASMMFGLSPELEMALYSLCQYTRLGGDCLVSLADNLFTIRTRNYKYMLRASHFYL